MNKNKTDELWDEIMFLTDRQARLALLAVADGKDLETGLRMAERYGQIMNEVAEEPRDLREDRHNAVNPLPARGLQNV